MYSVAQLITVGSKRTPLPHGGVSHFAKVNLSSCLFQANLELVKCVILTLWPSFSLQGCWRMTGKVSRSWRKEGWIPYTHPWIHPGETVGGQGKVLHTCVQVPVSISHQRCLTWILVLQLKSRGWLGSYKGLQFAKQRHAIPQLS